jgi:hypothetical protein
MNFESNGNNLVVGIRQVLPNNAQLVMQGGRKLLSEL